MGMRERAGTSDQSRAGLRAAAMEAAAHGDGEQARFRDAQCFIPMSREGRAEEEGFSVHRGGGDAMSGAVLDLMEDEAVRFPSRRRTLACSACACLKGPAIAPHSWTSCCLPHSLVP